MTESCSCFVCDGYDARKRGCLSVADPVSPPDPPTTDLAAALRDLCALVRRTCGYMKPEDQAALWRAEALLGGAR